MIKTKKFRKLLDKTNNLFDNIQASKGAYNQLEIDLLKSYLVRLYELCLVNNGSTSPNSVDSVEKQEVSEALISHSNEVRLDVKDEEPLEVPVIEPEIKEEPVETIIESNGSNDEPELHQEIIDLFNEKEVTDLSDRLGKIPVDDLNKTMGINERIFTIQELFGGDQSDFDETIRYLNGLNSFEEARDFLMREKAVKFEWASKAHRKKAVHFINQVRRKYY